MSKYIPTSPWLIVDVLRREGLVAPRPGHTDFLTEAHSEIDDALARQKARLAEERAIPQGLGNRWSNYFDALATFVSMTHRTYWYSIYGDDFLRSMCDVVFGRSLRIELCRPRTFRRRVLLVGDTGCGRPGIGDVIRQLVLECLVRTLSVGSSGAPTRSAKVSIGHDAIEVELFGGFRSGTSEQSVGLLSECADSALFLDGALSMPENLRRRLLDAVEAMESGHTAQRVTTAANLHLIAGARRDEFSNLREKHSVTQALFQSLCRDGLLTIPRLGDVLASGARWHEIFDVVYRHVARTYCGLATPSLHRYGGLSQAFHSDDIDTDTVAEEQRTFLDWITAPARITQIADMVRIEFEGYDWPGNLREFEALMQRLIESQVTPELNPQKIMQACTDFRHRRTGPIEGQGSTSNWLLRFERELDALPLTHAALPQVMGQLEARYYREAAERAAVARHPKNARIQDVARMLGIPRQTAARKWQHYNLPSSLLTKDSNQDV